MVKKHILDVDEDTWIRVVKYKLNHRLKNNNEALVELVKKGLAAKKR